MSTQRQKVKPPLQLDWTDDDEVPRASAPDGMRLAKRQRRYRRVVWSTVWLTPCALLALIVVAGSKAPAAPPVVHSVVNENTSPGRTAATQELDAWLAETPSPLPGAKVVSWDGATSVATVSPPPGATSTGAAGGTPWPAEIDTFTLEVPEQPPSNQPPSSTPPSYTVYKAGIEVALDPAGGAVALGGPSLTVEPPTPSANADPSVGPWPGIQSATSVSQPVSQAIQGWLAAYTSGSSSSLGLSVGDPNSAHAYIPLSGVSSATDTVMAAASLPNGAEIVEVTLNLVWDGQTPPQSGSQSGSSLPQTTMDLLIERANTAAPVVVAWGPPGSGPTLTPYENAVSPSALAASQGS